jgi:hypothetical protein
MTDSRNEKLARHNFHTQKIGPGPFDRDEDPLLSLQIQSLGESSSGIIEGTPRLNLYRENDRLIARSEKLKS